MIELIIVEDSPALITCIEKLLIENTNYKIRIKASNGFDVVQKLKTTPIKPRIAIVDINMPVMDGVSLTQFLAKNYKEIFVIGISLYDHIEAFSAILLAGAKGFICKSNLTLLPEAIDKVKQGDTYIDPSVRKEWEKYEEKIKDKKDIISEFRFSDTQIEHLQLIPTDLTLKQIASITNQSTHTVHQHQKEIKKKTGLSSRTSQVVFSIKYGISKVFRIRF